MRVVRRDELRAQLSVTRIESLYLYLLPISQGDEAILGVVRLAEMHWEPLLRCTLKRLKRSRCRFGDDSCGLKEPRAVWGSKSDEFIRRREG